MPKQDDLDSDSEQQSLPGLLTAKSAPSDLSRLAQQQQQQQQFPVHGASMTPFAHQAAQQQQGKRCKQQSGETGSSFTDIWQQPQLLQGHPTVAVQPADLLRYQQQQRQHSCNGRTDPPEGGWELSPSGAASPCGAVHSELLDLFADLADTEVVVYNRCVLLSAVYCSLCKGCRWQCSCLVRWACAGHALAGPSLMVCLPLFTLYAAAVPDANAAEAADVRTLQCFTLPVLGWF